MDVRVFPGKSQEIVGEQRNGGWRHADVESGAIRSLKGMEKFLLLYPRAHRIVVGSPETMLGDFLAGEVELFLL